MKRIIPSSVILLSDERESWSKPANLMDSWLESEGYYRKHIARDASSLFRCVSEVVFLTQAHHLIVRRHCIQFAKYQPETFRSLTHISVKEYIERLSNPREWGTTLDMQIMSLIYKLEFAVYKEIMKPWEKITSNGFKVCIFLSLSHDHHYDSVYPRSHITNTAICQSILYEVLYKLVFKLEEVDFAVHKMLHDKSARYQTEFNMALFSAGLFQMRLEMRDNCRNVKQLLNCGITPFPYKVAKSLDPNIYRNVEYDTWNEQKRGLRHMLSAWNNNELQVGSRCTVNFFDDNQKIVRRHGYIQEMTPNKGPVVVFIEELGEKRTVPYERLELILNSNENESDDEDGHQYDQCPDFSSKEKKVCVNDKKSATVNDCYDIAPNKYESKTYVCNVSESGNIQYTHSTNAIPTSCHGYITSQNCQTDTNVSRSSLAGTPHSSTSTTLPEGQQKITVIDNSTPMSYSTYSQPVYPTMLTPDMNVPPPTPVLTSNLANTKSQLPEEYLAGSSVRCGFNDDFNPYYGYGYSTYPYCVIPTGVVYPVQPGNTLQSNSDATRVTYSYPIPQMTNEVLYAMPMSSNNAKTDVPVYSAQGMYHSPVKKTVPVNTKVELYGKETTNLSPPQPMISSSLYPVAYPSYSAPYCYSYDYCTSCPEVQRCDNVSSSYHQLPQLLPVAYSDDVYSTNSQVYCQPMLPLSIN